MILDEHLDEQECSARILRGFAILGYELSKSVRIWPHRSRKEYEVRKLILGMTATVVLGLTVPATAQSVEHRQSRQEQRIRHGERTGRLTAAEAHRLRSLEMRLRRTEARMRWRNGGHLTSQQRRRLRQMERRDSAQIYRLKHNARHY